MASQEMNDWIVRVLGASLPGTQRPSESSPGNAGMEAFAKLRDDWNNAKTAVSGDLARLREAVLTEFGEDPLASSIDRLDAILAHFDAGLADRLDDLANATPAERDRPASAATAIVAEYESYILNDPLIDLVETNPFTQILLWGRLSGPLSAIRQALGSIAA